MILSCSYLSSKDKENTIKELNKTAIDYIHVDVMDGEFVSNETLDFNRLRNYFYDNKKNLDVHLMVKNVKLYVELYSLLNPKYITFHIENGNTLELINYVKNKNIRVGLAVNPDTDVDMIKPFLDKVDLILVMSVVPGRGGQSFIELSLDKIRKIRRLNKDIVISVDGGINNINIKKIKEAGASMSVIGSYITNNDINEKVRELKDITGEE